MNTKEIKKPSLFIALLPILFLIPVMLVGVIKFDTPAQLPLIVGCVFTCLIGKHLGHSWESMEESMIETNKMAMQANFIIMIVGCLIGTWVLGGVVPGMIYYGLQLFTPRIFLMVLPIICALISISTGSAWSTAGTMGTAAMGIGAGLGIPPAIVAGAVVTGSSFGDKMSPLSDSTNLAAGVTKAGLFNHIRQMLYTTVPSFIIALILYGIIGSRFSASDMDIGQITSITDTIAANFKISPIIFLAPAVIIGMIAFKVPAVPGMIVGTAVGILLCFWQGQSIPDILGAIYEGVSMETGNAMVDRLLNRGGLLFMMETISLVICALCFGGAIKAIGCLDTIIESILKFCHTRGSIIASNVVMCICCNFAAADQYMSIVIPGQMYEDVYRDLNLHPANLSRTLEDSGTLTSGLVPWSTCGAVYLATLGVSAFAYGRFHFLGLINPIIAIIYGYTGLFLRPLDPSKRIGKVLTPELYEEIKQ